jgi:predicted PurR-regulated permease PerM
MNIAELFKKNFILVPVIASVLVGTFTGVRYIVNLTDTINDNKTQIINLQRDLKVSQEKLTDQNTRLTSAESTWQMAENLYRQLADQVREHSYDIKDLNR